MSRIGLKGFWKDHRGCKLWRKLKNFRMELRYAWQRAWKGYDFIDVIAPGDRTCERLQAVLPEFYERHSEIIDRPEVDEAVLEIIDLLGYIDDERAEKEFCPDGQELTVEAMIKACQLQNEKLKEAFTLFGEYVTGLSV